MGGGMGKGMDVNICIACLRQVVAFAPKVIIIACLRQGFCIRALQLWRLNRPAFY
jgi:hypothetical protein